MTTNIDTRAKIAEIWLTGADQQDDALQQALKAQYARWKREGYRVAVYRSGTADLYSQTRDLLASNKRRAAEQAVQRAKQRQTERKQPERVRA